MKKTIVYFLHFSFWFANLMLLFIIMAILCYSELIEESNASYYLKLILSVGIIPAVFSFYTFYRYLLPKTLKELSVKRTLVYGVLLAAFSSILGAVSLYLTLDFDLSCHKQSSYFGFLLMSIIGFIYGVIGFIIKGFISWYEELKIKEELIQKNHDMELALVKSQLDPHFLFNTINNIDVLILKDPEEASSYLNRLSDIMRFMLFETKENHILLSQEIEYISKYIDLQKIRSANADYIKYNVQGDAYEKYIAPMVFISFIENAFKYCTNKKEPSAISIDIDIAAESVQMKLNNAYDIHQNINVDSHGLGSDLIKKRLDLLYPEKYNLATHQADGRYYVDLKIDL